jgi:branched-chain amino acid transport system permease protein
MTFSSAAKRGGLSLLFWVLGIAILAALFFTGTVRGLLPNVITLAIIYAIAALGLNLIVGHTGQLAIGHAGFFMIGGYISALLFIVFQVPWFLAFLIGGVFAGIAGLLIGIPTLKLRGDYLAIVTLGFGQIINSTLNNLFFIRQEVTLDGIAGPPLKILHNLITLSGDFSLFNSDTSILEYDATYLVNGANGIGNIPGFAPGVMGTPWAFLWSAITLMIVAIFLRNLNTSSHGRAMTSIREDEIAAGTMGINVFNTKLLAFVVSAFITGVAGGLYVVQNRSALPAAFNFLTSVNFVIIIVLGGLGSNTGAILGSFIFLLTQEWLLRDVIPLSNYKGLIFSFVLILLMIFFPGGLLGKKELTHRLLNKWFKGLTPFDKPSAPIPDSISETNELTQEEEQ